MISELSIKYLPSISRIHVEMLGMVVQIYNPSSGDAEIGGFLELPPVSLSAVRISKSEKLNVTMVRYFFWP